MNFFSNLDFTDLNICVDCIKGKQTKHTKKGATRNIQLFEIIETDMCGPFDTASFSKEFFLSLLLTIFHVLGMPICCMKNLKRQML